MFLTGCLKVGSWRNESHQPFDLWASKNFQKVNMLYKLHMLYKTTKQILLFEKSIVAP